MTRQAPWEKASAKDVQKRVARTRNVQVGLMG